MERLGDLLGRVSDDERDRPDRLLERRARGKVGLGREGRLWGGGRRRRGGGRGRARRGRLAAAAGEEAGSGENAQKTEEPHQVQKRIRARGPGALAHPRARDTATGL